MDPRSTPAIMRGAVDLGALRERSVAAERAAEDAANRAGPATPPGDPSPAGGAGDGAVSGNGVSGNGASGVAIIDVTEATFQSEVLERSLTTPVVIDFWAEWCGPCRQLSPVLEKLAMEGDGAWVLAKIDVDANPRIAQAFRVQGIPMVFAVVGGQPVDAFTGVVPEAQLRPWIDAVLASAGAGGQVPLDPALEAADDAMVAGDLDEAERAYRKVLAERGTDPVAEAGLAQVGLLRRVAGVDAVAAFAAATANPDDVAAQGLAADIEVISGQAEQAYARMVELVRRSFGDDRDRARQHLISLFAVADPEDPAVLAARRALANALF